MSPYQKHVATWKVCQRCPLHLTRHKVCIARGSIPAPVLFVGEAPGKSEDVIGNPFVGPAGQLLDRIIYQAMEGIPHCLTNLVGCIPLDEDGQKTAEPSKESIAACSPKLKELVRLVKPRLVVLVGTLARKHVVGQAQFSIRKDNALEWIPEGQYLEMVEVYHPAFILRSNVAAQGLMIQKCVVTLTNAVEELCLSSAS